MFKLFKRKPEKPKRLRDYLNIEFKEALNKSKPDHLTGLKKHLGTKFTTDLRSAERPLFHLHIFRIL